MARNAYKDILKPFKTTDRIGKPEVTGYEDVDNGEMLASDAGLLTEIGLKRMKLRKISASQAEIERNLYSGEMPLEASPATQEDLAAFFADGGFFRAETPDYSDVDPADWEDHNASTPIDEDLGKDHDDYDELTITKTSSRPEVGQRQNRAEVRLDGLYDRLDELKAKLTQVNELDADPSTSLTIRNGLAARRARFERAIARCEDSITHARGRILALEHEAKSSSTDLHFGSKSPHWVTEFEALDAAQEAALTEENLEAYDAPFTTEEAWTDSDKDAEWANRDSEFTNADLPKPTDDTVEGTGSWVRPAQTGYNPGPLDVRFQGPSDEEREVMAMSGWSLDQIDAEEAKLEN